MVDRGNGEEIIVALSRVVRSYDAKTGELLWEAWYVINQLVSSPVIQGDLLIVAGGAHSVRQVVGFRLTGSGRDTSVEKIWAGQKNAPQVASPVLYKNLLFSVTNRGVMGCRDAATGELLWEQRLAMRGMYGSLVAGDGKVYVFSRWGQGAVIAASPEFQILAENLLDDFGGGLAGASPAVADGALLLRGQQFLYKIGNGPAPVREKP